MAAVRALPGDQDRFWAPNGPTEQEGALDRTEELDSHLAASVGDIPASAKRRSRTSSHEPNASAAASRIGSLVLATSWATVAIGQASAKSVISIIAAAPSKNVRVALTTSAPSGKKASSKFAVDHAASPYRRYPQLLLPSREEVVERAVGGVAGRHDRLEPGARVSTSSKQLGAGVDDASTGVAVLGLVPRHEGRPYC